MYNRYIPQPDGSYQRKRMDETHRAPPRPAPPPPENPPCPPARPEQPQSCPPPASSQKASHQKNGGSFLQQLLPGDFDMSDLMVIILLLLIAGDCENERSNALLTLALYLIM